MKKILGVVVIAALFFMASGMRFSVLRDEVIYNAVTIFVEPPEKFWVHRCDSVEKASEMLEKFAGIEIDVLFYPEENFGRKFDVSHDRQAAVEYPLENFMPVFAQESGKIWFDFKNLTAENSNEALAELTGLLEKYSIDRQRFIVESHNVNALKIFHDAGFYTSYYVTNDNRAEILSAAESGNVDAISFPLSKYDFAKSLGVAVDLLTWIEHGERWWSFYRREDLGAVADDSQVKVILVKFATTVER